MPTKSGTVRRPMCASVQTLRSPAAFPISPWTPYQPLLLPLVRHFLLPPQVSAHAVPSTWKAHSHSLERPILQPLRSGLQVACSSYHLIWECTPSLSVLFLSRVRFSTAHIPSQNCDANLLYYVVGVSSPRREASNNEFPCFILLCCSWDLG